MDCNEFQNQITPAVDKLLPKKESESFAAHAGACPQCRYDYEAESLTKKVVMTKATMVRTPGTVMQKILELLSREEASTASPQRWTFLGLSNRPYVKPALALAAACVAVLVILQLSRQDVTRNALPLHLSNNVIEQTLANYTAVVQGQVKPQLASNIPAQVQGFFAGKTDFPVVIPELGDFTLAGAVLNEHAGTTLAHVLYVRGDQTIYMYEACWRTVIQGEKLQVPEHVREELLRTGWFAETRRDGESLVLWTDGTTLCAAVSCMEKNELMTRLASSTRAAVPGVW